MNRQYIDEAVIEEIGQLFTEGEFASRWTLIETYHRVGEIINSVDAERTKVLQALAPKVGRSVRSLWYASKFYDKYPDLNLLPEGKNVSWNKIITNHLTVKKKECKHHNTHTVCFSVCEDCRRHLGKVDKIH